MIKYKYQCKRKDDIDNILRTELLTQTSSRLNRFRNVMRRAGCTIGQFSEKATCIRACTKDALLSTPSHVLESSVRSSRINRFLPRLLDVTYSVITRLTSSMQIVTFCRNERRATRRRRRQHPCRVQKPVTAKLDTWYESLGIRA